MVFLAGMTCETQPTLPAQCADILPRAGALLAETGCDWGNVVRVSFFLQRDQDPDALLADVAALAPVPLEEAEIELVEGFSRPRKLVEIEITARRTAVSAPCTRLPAASRLGREAQAPGRRQGLAGRRCGPRALPAISMVTTMRSSAAEIATTRAPLGSMAVTSARASASLRRGKPDSR